MTAGGISVSRKQSMDALERGNRIRLERAHIRRDIAAGAIPVTDVLLDPPESCANMSLMALLTAQHRWGARRARRVCYDLVINELRPIGKLTERQRHAIVARLEEPVNGCR